MMLFSLSMVGIAGFSRYSDWAGLLLVPVVVLGIHWMRSPKTAVWGNGLSMFAMAGFVLLAAGSRQTGTASGAWAWVLSGGIAGVWMAGRIRMIRMPEMIALFNGIGGAASAMVAMVVLAAFDPAPGMRIRAVALLAVCIGSLTFSGSAVAVLKLSRILNAAPITFRGQGPLRVLLSVLLISTVVAGTLAAGPWAQAIAWLAFALGTGMGLAAMIRVGGADMPVSISLLNALSGVAAAVAGYAVGNPVPVAVGAIVGAGGLMLTMLMCRAMNRRLGDVLGGRTARNTGSSAVPDAEAEQIQAPAPVSNTAPADPVELLRAAGRVVIVPGYGMALAQAQRPVRRLFDALEKLGKEVCFAVHPVAGRMPGHMHVLLAEVDLPYQLFREMDDINPEFPNVDIALIVGANDVINPAASTAKGTPIYGMPVLHADKARAVIVCNLDDQPGYAGVPNPLFTLPGTVLNLGNAAETITHLAEALEKE